MNPSRAQLRMLHILTRGTITFQSWPIRRFDVEDLKAQTYEGWQFHEITARVIVDRRWAALHKFDARHGEYGITIDGLSLANEICECPGRGKQEQTAGAVGRKRRERSYRGRMILWHLEESTEILAGRLLCIKCARRINCVSRKTEAHPATRWHVRYGPVCDKHP